MKAEVNILRDYERRVDNCACRTLISGVARVSRSRQVISTPLPEGRSAPPGSICKASPTISSMS
jgi:hypothetical protein